MVIGSVVTPHRNNERIKDSDMENTGNSAAYESAVITHNDAYAKFDAARKLYRAMKATDAQFLAAKTEYDAALAAFDAAYAQEVA
jgi:hypothetical protein